MGSLLRRVRERASALPWTSIPRPAFLVGGAITVGLAIVMALTAGGVTAQTTTATQAREPAEFPAGAGAPVPPSRPAGQAGSAAFSGIILPDILIVAPHGVSQADVRRLGAIAGVRKLITFDGAQITLAGQPVNVIGVQPDQFRSWVPLPTASDQRLWTGLAAGDFVASSRAAVLLNLTPGASYQLTGASATSVRFAGAARLGITGVGVLVNQAVSRKLGLVHQIAVLISAPGPDLATLSAQVRQVLGGGAKVVGLRGRGLPAGTAPAHITSYLQLFQASASKFCPAMSWTVLAAIGQIESGDGQNMGPSSAGALGPMQFMPATWAQWGIDGFGPPGPPDIMNPFDAVPSAARMLCADGASSGTAAGLRQAIFAYNHADWYVNEVLALAQRYAAEYH
ncbi:MAG TPA: lytic transglycosylase domain-containing protein [Streptosporangiaceae bacterium]